MFLITFSGLNSYHVVYFCIFGELFYTNDYDRKCICKENDF